VVSLSGRPENIPVEPALGNASEGINHFPPTLKLFSKQKGVII